MQIHLGENIRRLRKEAGLTQAQLAEALGVTTGAVYKWESGKATPELEMLVDIAEFFETSVDALLDYGWQRLSMGETAEKIRVLRATGDFEEACRYAEKAIQKYPNSFEVVYQSALMYSLMMSSETAGRAIELFERACKLIDQNPYDNVSEWLIKNKIAVCYDTMGSYDEAVERLKKNNFEGINNSRIGSILARHCRKPDEALQYLSDGLLDALASLFNLTIGYANAYAQNGKMQKARDIVKWMFDICQGLRQPDSVNYMVKNDVLTLVMLAEISAMLADEDAAYTYLKQARTLAMRFDAAPNYGTDGILYYHGKDARAYDDFGQTAMAAIENCMANDETGPHLLTIWEKIQSE